MINYYDNDEIHFILFHFLITIYIKGWKKKLIKLIYILIILELVDKLRRTLWRCYKLLFCLERVLLLDNNQNLPD